MKKLMLQIGIIGGLFSMIACEKVIDVPLNDDEKQIVVEGVGRNFLGESYVILSRSGSVYDDSGFEKLSGAVVTVTDKDGNETVFAEDPSQPGRYIAPAFQATSNNEYTLNINVEGKNLSASSETYSVPEIDSLSYIPTFGGFGQGSSEDTNYLVFYHFSDPAEETNFYRVRAWVNGERDDNFYLTDDALGNGQNITAPFFATSVKPKDTIHVELLSMDEDTYDYLFTLNANLTQGAFAASPANPVTNINEGAMGYFGVYMVDTMSIIMP